MGKPVVSRTSEKQGRTACSSCCFGFLTLILGILIYGSLGLAIFWILHYQGGFEWNGDPAKKFNFHPVLMIGGFVFLMGQAMLSYRVCCCCRHIYNKLFHTILHLLAMPAIAIGVVAVFDYHDRQNIPHLYSIHSWMGVGTVGLFCLQFLVGFFSFLVLLCCDTKTAKYRAALHPIHVHFGIATFLMAIGTCITGLVQKIFFTTGLASNYKNLPEEGLVVNVLAMVLVGVGLLMTFILRYHRFQRVNVITVSERL